MSDFLQQMAKSSAERAKDARRNRSAWDLGKPSYPLRLEGFDLIAEIKNRSPAEGALARDAGTRSDRALGYVAGGAAAISVLTEPQRFDGDLGHLDEVVTAVSAHEVPVMRKDFLVDVVQVEEAKAFGASGVLLIAAMLEDKALNRLLDCAFEHDLFVLLESFNQDDWERSLALLKRPRYQTQTAATRLLFGINTRDLRSLAVDPTRLQAFSSQLPQNVVCVAESGQHTADDAATVSALGYSAALVGTALMRARQPQNLMRDMLQAGRQVHA